jgi:hypothetical protein
MRWRIKREKAAEGGRDRKEGHRADECPERAEFVA